MSQFDAVGVILLLVLFSCAKVLLQGRVSRSFLHNASDSLLFHAQLFLITALLLGVVFPPISFPSRGWLMAFAAGAFSMLYQVTYAAALRMGSVSLTVLIANFNTILTALFCMIAFHERIYLSQLLGIALLILSMVLLSKHEARKCPVRGKWFLLSLVAMLSCAAASIIMKLFVKWESTSVDMGRSFVAVMYFFAALIAGLLYLQRRNGRTHEKSTYSIKSAHLWISALTVAAVLGGYQIFYTLGIAQISGGFLYPTYAGMQSLAMTGIGMFAFGDKLERRQWVGVACGIACIVLMNLQIFPLA